MNTGYNRAGFDPRRPYGYDPRFNEFEPPMGGPEYGGPPPRGQPPPPQRGEILVYFKTVIRCEGLC